MEAREQLAFFLDETARTNGIVFDAPREGDAGFDIRANEALMLEPNQQHAVKTGLRIGVPLGWVGIVKDRSSVASRGIYSHAGVIDSGYRGELLILISNRGSEPFEISVGQKIAQLLVVPVLTSAVCCSNADELGSTERGSGGFGSTGTH